MGSVKWLEMSDRDSPGQHKFAPRHPSGPTIVDSGLDWNPLELFRLFFNVSAMRSLITNTNKMAQKREAAGKKFNWHPVTTEEFYTFLAVIIFCGLVKCPTKEDYWRTTHPYNFPFPASVMSRQWFHGIFWCLHLSDPDEDEENEQEKGTLQYDQLFKVKPLYNDILLACKTVHHPGQQLSIDERMVATKARLGFKQYLPLKMGDKAVRSCRRTWLHMELFYLWGQNPATVDRWTEPLHCHAASGSSTFRDWISGVHGQLLHQPKAPPWSGQEKDHGLWDYVGEP